MLEEKEVVSRMLSFGYSFVSERISKEKGSFLRFIKPINSLESHIDAEVELKAERMNLSFNMLKLYMSLSSNTFAWNHPEFKKYEETLIMYAAKCKEFDPLEIIQGLRKVEVVSYTKEENTITKKDIKERRAEFWAKVKEISKKREYSEQTARDFMAYWCQKNEKGTKYLFEITKTKTGIFDIGGRMATWKKNEEAYGPKKKSFTQEKIERQTEQTIAKPHIYKKDRF